LPQPEQNTVFCSEQGSERDASVASAECRPAKTLPRELAVSYEGSVDPRCDTRGENRFRRKTSTTLPSPRGSILGGGGRTHSEGSRIDVSKERYRRNPSFRRRSWVLFHHLSGAEEGWQNETSHKSESAEHVRRHESFQTRRYPYSQRSYRNWRLVDKDRHEGCVFHHPYGRIRTAVPPFFLRRETLPVHVSPLRFIQCPMGLYQDLTASDSLAQRAWGESGDIPRRHFGTGPNATRGEIDDKTLATHGVSGFYDRHNRSDTSSSWREIEKSQNRSKEASFKQPDIIASTISFDRKNELPVTGNSPGTSVLQKPAEGPDGLSGVREPELRVHLPLEQRQSRGITVVDHTSGKMERPQHDQSTTGAYNRVGCFPMGMGRDNERCTDRRSLERHRTQDAHQLPRNFGGLPCSEDLFEANLEPSGSPKVGQHDSCCLHQPYGRNSFPRGAETDERILDVVPREGPYYPSTTSPREGECGGRRGIPCSTGQNRLDASSVGVQRHPGDVRSNGDRPVCLASINTTSSVLQLAPGSLCDRNRRTNSGLVRPEGVRKPTMESDTPDSDEAPIAQRDVLDSSGPSVASTVMVPSATGSIDGLPSAYTEGRRSDVTYDSENISESASTLLLASWRKKSARSYDSAFLKWASWCQERNTDPISGPVSAVINFLADLFSQGYQYNSLNSYRSAISSTHDHVDGSPIGQHPLVTRMMAGAFNSRPPKARYSATWDVEIVLKYIISLGPNNNLSLKNLTLKTVMLLALTRPTRSVDLKLLDVDLCRWTPEGVSFIPSGLTKQAKAGRRVSDYFFPKFSENTLICPVDSVKEYIKITEEFRKTDVRTTQLFLSFIRPHSAVSSSSIARWLKTLLAESGIDVSLFKAHSTRSASASAAAAAGVTTKEILDAADWKTESVFQKFYYKPVHDSTFGQAVLGRK